MYGRNVTNVKCNSILRVLKKQTFSKEEIIAQYTHSEGKI
jgi:hypothetical protein